MKKFLTASAIIISLAMSFGALAQAQTPPVVNPNPAPNNTQATSTTTPANQALNIHINNPLSVSTIGDAINLFLGVIIKIALPLIILFFIWAGMTFVLARGNPTEIQKAKTMFLYTVIGTLLILGAWVITNALIGTINSIVTPT